MNFTLSPGSNPTLNLIPESAEDRLKLAQLQAEMLASQLDPVRWNATPTNEGLPLSITLSKVGFSRHLMVKDY